MLHTSPSDSVLRFAFEVRKLVTELDAALNVLFRPIGLTCVQAEALMALAQLGPVTLTKLGDHLVAESGHPSRLVSRLVDAGLVTRAASVDDARAVILQLTAAGRDLANQAHEARAPLLGAFAERYDGRLDAAIDLVQDFRQSLAQR